MTRMAEITTKRMAQKVDRGSHQVVAALPKVKAVPKSVVPKVRKAVKKVKKAKKSK